MPPLTIDGVVHPDEYEVRVDSAKHPVRCHPADAGTFCEVYYAFDGASLHFGVRRTRDVKIEGVAIWVDSDQNGCEIGDLLVAVEPEHRLANYGVFDAPGQVNEVAGKPPNPAAAGVDVRCFALGDTEVKLHLSRQYQNGLQNPLPAEMNVNVTVQATLPDGREVINFLNSAPITTFVIAFE